MTLKKKGKYWYGTTPADTRTEVGRYSRLNAYEAVKFAASACACNNRTFKLETDEDEGVARRTCTACGSLHLMGDGEQYADGANLEAHECVCGGEAFELLSGVALYDGSNDVRWYYIGCHRPRCQLTGVFADWKCEAGDAEAFLVNI